MTRKILPALAALGWIATPGTASAQDVTSPEITFDAPVNGVTVEGSRQTISGTADDGNGTVTGIVSRVEYRIEGNRRWRRAILVTPGEESTTWVARVYVRKRSARRIYVRAYDDSKNESDIIGRRLRRERR